MEPLIPTFTVGITGHRWNKIPESERERISEQLASVFTSIDLAVQQSPRVSKSAKIPVIRLVSALAEGADQIAIWSRPKGWPVDAILPFPLARYLEDFASAHATGGIDRRPAFENALGQARSIIELPNEIDAVRGYERVGEALLRVSNLLVAVWDGSRATGLGGTETVVTQAVSLGIPVVWISSQRDCPPKLLSSSAEASDPPTTVSANAGGIRETVEKILDTLATASPPIPAERRNSCL